MTAGRTRGKISYAWALEEEVLETRGKIGSAWVLEVEVLEPLLREVHIVHNFIVSCSIKCRLYLAITVQRRPSISTNPAITITDPLPSQCDNMEGDRVTIWTEDLPLLFPS